MVFRRKRALSRAGLAVLCAAKLILTGSGIAYAAEAEPPTLIQIGVEVVEVDEQKTEKLGVQWFSNLHIEEASVPAVLEIGTLTRSKLFADIDMLLQDGAADLLANPKLVTRDGTTAVFHAGGEIPYIVSSGLGNVSVEFKPYGVNLQISPKLNADGKIVLTINAEVSGPDEQSSVTLSGNVVPGILSRQVNSQLTLDRGTTLTLAGLIQNQKQWTRLGVPVLMHIPLLGHLFSHRAETNRRTSIVVFVTPTILEEGKGLGTAS